jgi:hypothetical protein
VRSPLVRQRRRRDALPASQRRGAAIRLEKDTGLRYSYGDEELPAAVHAPHGCCSGVAAAGGGGGKGERGASGARSLVRVLGFHLFEDFFIFGSFR